MPKLTKNMISLNQAAKISGYTQDYLGYLIRRGEIKAVRTGRNWFTTEEQVREYIFKKKIRSEEFAIKEFLSPRRVKKIILFTVATFFIVFVIWSKFYNGPLVPVEEVRSAMTSDGESLKILEAK
ncbi:MAG TPA: hypothetical protein PLG45_01555 [Candidatus Paceibacterota bacterium]|jgi:hypothetical protein|nr:hypothetical protein [Candidatus Paceibacterota bacterium]HPI66820.1 hypothetical protein [Candidatus Paceibacterota bacterium]HPI81959.1 hypothetical protein [Candidatus Paceibacterota bacterium]HPK14279.1 hypothetical protein [Candidatus Paceibacterota bacterium]HQM18875.1 hypothetical protein [Candidatus Paceibacterota bacterium]